MREEVATRLLRRAIGIYRKLKEILSMYDASNIGELLDRIRTRRLTENT